MVITALKIFRNTVGMSLQQLGVVLGVSSVEVISLPVRGGKKEHSMR